MEYCIYKIENMINEIKKKIFPINHQFLSIVLKYLLSLCANQK